MSNGTTSGTVLPESRSEPEPIPASVAEVSEDDYLVMETGDLYIWDLELDAFRQPDMVENPVEVRIVQTGQYQCGYYPIIRSNSDSHPKDYLRAKSQGMWVLGHKVTDEINGKANAVSLADSPLQVC